MTATEPPERASAHKIQKLKRQHNRVALIVTAVAVSMFAAVIALMFLIHYAQTR